MSYIECLAETTIAQADQLRGAASVLVSLMYQTQLVHGGELGNLLERVMEASRIAEEVIEHYHSSDPEQHCDFCVSRP